VAAAVEKLLAVAEQVGTELAQVHQAAERVQNLSYL
jgi:hypothetical protein